MFDAERELYTAEREVFDAERELCNAEREVFDPSGPS